MRKSEIVDELARNKEVESLVATYTKYASHPYIDDLSQDIYIILLNEDDELVERLYRDGTLSYYIRRIIKNNLCSTTSQFYYNYQRYRRYANELDEKY